MPGHMIFSGLWGYGMGLARITRNRRKAWLGVGLSWAAGAFAHGLYNASIEFQAWQDASEVTLYAGLALPVVFLLSARVFRHHVALARLWTTYHRRSLTVRRLVAGALDRVSVVASRHRLAPGSPPGPYWSACVNVATQRTLDRLARGLDAPAEERLIALLRLPEAQSRDVDGLLQEIAPVDEVVAGESRAFQQLLRANPGPGWRDRRQARKLRKRLRWELKVEAAQGGPVREFGG